MLYTQEKNTNKRIGMNMIPTCVDHVFKQYIRRRVVAASIQVLHFNLTGGSVQFIRDWRLPYPCGFVETREQIRMDTEVYGCIRA